MSRNTDSSVTSATQLTQQRFRALAEVFSFSGGTMRICSGGNFVICGANTFSPIGGLGSVENIQEDASPFPRAVRMRIALVNSAAMYEALNETLFQKPIKLYRTVLTDSYTTVGTPQLSFYGFINTANIVLEEGQNYSSYLELEVETRLKQPGKAIYLDKQTHQQVMGFTDDEFFNHVAKIPLTIAHWGDGRYAFDGADPWHYDGPVIDLPNGGF